MEYPHQSSPNVEEEEAETAKGGQGVTEKKARVKYRTQGHFHKQQSGQQQAVDKKPERKDKTLGDPAAQHRFPWTREMVKKLRSTLKRRFQHLMEGAPKQGETRLLHEIYTELYITEGKEGGGEVNDEHEIRQIERASWQKVAQDKIIICNDIFKRPHRQQKPIRTVLTKGVAGIGKTVSVSKFVLDWAEGKANWDVRFIFPLPVRELNLMKMRKLSLLELIQNFFPEIQDPRIFTHSKCRIMFIFDGLDECRLPLDFIFNPQCCSITKPASVDILLTNLIKGDLLPSALLWITTRPAAASQIPPECVDQMTEIRGFNDPQKEEYFRKRFTDENLANQTLTHLKSSRSLFIMCHIPIFCWISATVVEKTLHQLDKPDMPRTLTQMYAHFLTVLTNNKKEKYREVKETDEEMIFKLGKLAFQQLENGNLIFYEEDMMECGIDVTEASVYSGLCTQIFREESLLCQGKVFSFVHLSIQEFLAALYVFLCFSNRQRNIPDQQQTSELSALFRAATLHELHKTAVNLALLSQNGHLDLFLRFLLGLSLESNQALLRHLLPRSSSQPQSSEQIVQYIKNKIKNQNALDRKINLFYCLNELNHHAIVDVIDRSSGNLSLDILLPGEWEIRRLEFKISADQLHGFDLQMYMKTPEKDQTELLSPQEILKKLLPVVTSALLRDCSLTEESCAALASAARSTACSLKDLDLSFNGLHDAGGQHLSDLLKNPNCKLEKLVLRDCSLTHKSCAAFASAARSTPCHLKELDLCINNLHDAGVQQLSDLIKNNKLEKLVLMRCSLTETSCATLASAASATSCHLKELDLSNNQLHDAGVQHLCDYLKNPHCKLEKLMLRYCSLTEKSCASLASAVMSTSSSLKELNMSHNKLCDTGVQQLSDLVRNPHCKLEKLVVDHHKFLKESPAAAPASTSSSHSSDAAELHLTAKTQEEPATQLRSVDTHKEDHHIASPQRSCESCAEVPGSSHWVALKPEVSTEKSTSTYSLNSPAGSYECSVSGVRWSCAAPVTLQYCFTDWHVFAEELAHMQYKPAGPLMDIKLTTGKLEEIHLPHFLCLGGSEASVCDAMRVLHGRDGGVCVEECELARHHARILHPSFSLLGLVYSIMSLFSPKVHCELLLFCTRTAPLNLHAYLVPSDPAHIMKIHEKEKAKGVWIDKPSAVGPLRQEASVHVTTSCRSVIRPEKMNLWPLSTGNFCEVYIKHPEEEFDMEVISSDHTEPIWSVQVRRDDYQQPCSRGPGQVGKLMAAGFVDEHRAEIISRVREVMPIADALLSQGVIGQESYSNMAAASSSQARMRTLYEGLHSAGAQGKLAFYNILMAKEHLLVEDLWTT